LDPKTDLSLAFLKGTTFFTCKVSPKHDDFAGIAIDADPDAIGDAFGGFAGADDARDAVFARDDRRV
jgi:hypothetical protein